MCLIFGIISSSFSAKTLELFSNGSLFVVCPNEKLSESKPIALKIKAGQEAVVTEGPFKGTLVKICSIPSKGRIEVLLNILGSSRRFKILQKDLIL